MASKLLNPTRSQKEIIKAHNLNWSDWYIERRSELEDYLKLVNKATGATKIISKYGRRN